MSTHSPRPPADRRRSRATSTAIGAAAALFEAGLDRSAIERMLLATAVSREGGGFARAHLLTWNPDRDCFEGRLCWTASGAPKALEDVVAAARGWASAGADPDATRLLRALRFAPGELDEALARAWVAGRIAIVPPAGARVHPWDAAAEIGVVALRHGTRGFGLVVGEWTEANERDRRTAALETLRRIGNAALATHAATEHARRATARASALAAFARAGVSSLNLAEATQIVVRLACETTGARGAALWKMGESADGRAAPPELVTSFGPAGVRERIGRGLQTLAASCAAEGRPIALERTAEAASIPPEIAVQISTAAAVPLAAYGRTLGALAVYDRVAQHPNDTMAFDPEDMSFLSGLADQCALTLRHASSEDAGRRTEQARRDLLRQLGRSERLAALGEMSVRVAHEARNPLASIAAFARRVHRSLGEDDPNREYLEVVMRETDRLERALADQLQLAGPGFASPDGPRLKMESVNALLQTSVQNIGEQLVRRRVRLLKKLTPDLPPLLLDHQRMASALQNILGHTLERVNAGGRIRIETRRAQQLVVVEIANDGRAEPGELLHELFVPFQLRGGSEPGLAVARQIILQHGGEVRVRSEGEWSTVFTLTLPIHDNQDRRHPGTDRRVSRADRRQRFPVT